MEPLKIINIKLVDFEFEKIIKNNESYLNLYPTHVEYILDYTASRPKDKDDPKVPWIEYKEYILMTILRGSMTGVILQRSQDSENWQVFIEYYVSDRIRIPYKKKSEAETMYKILSEYLLYP